MDSAWSRAIQGNGQFRYGRLYLTPAGLLASFLVTAVFCLVGVGLTTVIR